MTWGPRRRTFLASAASLALVSSLTAGCSLFETEPPPEDTAKALAAGLGKADLTSVPLKGTTSAEATAFLAAAFKGMGDVRPAVTVSGVERKEGSDEATATLRSTWDVSKSEKDWTYESQVKLVLVDNAWQVAWSPKAVVPDLAADEVLSVSRTWPKRADIVAADGTEIMTEREVVDVGLDKTKVTPARVAASATALARILGIDAKAYAAKVASAGPSAFVQALTLRVADPLLTKNTSRIDAVKGAARIPRMAVLAPTRTWAAPVLGSVSQATAEQVEKSGGVLRAGDEVGQGGLQLRYDEQLRGTPGLSIRALKKGADGSTLGKRELFAEQSVEGKPLTITLDSKAQSAAEAALASQTTVPTALVVVRPSTGEILAAAVGPGAKGAPLALAGKAAPGSTFKIVSSLALIRKGATAESKLPCTNTLNVGGRVFGNYSDYPKDKLGDISLRTALAFSCNTAFISQHKAISQDDLVGAAQSLGMGEKLDLDFTGFLGSVPTTDNLVEHAASLIGQGRIEASPLTMALVTASVMKGETVRPKLIADGETLPAPATPLSAAEAEVLRQEMVEVVRVGSGRRLAAVGVQYAKTGTAEFGTSNPPKTHAWMVAGLGDLAIAAYNEEGPSGSTHAAPFIAAFLKSYTAR
ncbi:MAG TPA: penicillin-binding transpeptidase domain-containing protein [Dermatophilaceae bacterium]|nr:penicillin-binding transpeptidase domain-containing protein [Dermatophilaceae bacterium]